jgi:glycosyltransferase involved in cell wall biosynthesis
VLKSFHYLRRTRPAVLLSFLHYTNIAALLAAKLAPVSTRVVICEQNTMSQYSRHTPAQRGQRAVRLMPLLAHLLYPHAQGIVAASAGVADDLARTARLPRRRITVIYNPVVTPELLTQAAAPLDHPWFVPGAPPVILGVGRLVPQKDFATLLRAFASVRQQHPARLLILGEGQERAQLAALASALHIHEDVALPGFVDNPFMYMARAAVFGLSSRWEGLANVVIEALACGAPVVATDCPHGPREILADGRYGALVPVGDSEALAAAILAALDAPPAAEQLQARAAHFSREQAVTRYLDVMGAGKRIVAAGE